MSGGVERTSEYEATGRAELELYHAWFHGHGWHGLLKTYDYVYLNLSSSVERVSQLELVVRLPDKLYF